MAFRKVDDLEVGMEVAADILAPSGQCLLKAGSVLSESIILLLAARGVRGVEVHADDEQSHDLSPEEIEQLQREVDASLEFKFARIGGDPRMESLRPVFRKWLLARKVAS